MWGATDNGQMWEGLEVTDSCNSVIQEFRYIFKKKSVVPAEENIYSLQDPWPTGSR